ncbi:MAG: hypothetical protein F2667_06340 [Actinobacteria bacterium]|uniref:Unannotated protein n=1 Tax=freshwater metagenome TaxID=449393 RepID=A0A6J6QC60_9ZZZZ|nr:hypothetical protein [Actinomycetota bacterium]
MTSRRAVVQDLAWTTVLSVVVLGPLLIGSGYWLFGDMVFVPHQPWKDGWLGLDGAAPRAVPMDALVSLLTQVVPGSVVQRVLLVGAFLVGGLGAGRLVGAHGALARAAAISLMLWNPWVHDRLMLGQWAILAGYFLLPWVAVTALRAARDLRRGLPPLWVALTLAAVCSPSSGLMAVLVALVLGAGPLRRTTAVASAGLVANLPWLVPSLVASGSTLSTDDVFGAFGARAETSGGTMLSLLSLGGTWKTSIVAPERTSLLIVVLAAGLSAVALLGLRHSRWPADSRSEPVPRLALLAALCLGIAALPTLPGGEPLLETLGRWVPSLAVLRDSQRYLAPAVLLLLPGIAGAVTWARAQVRPGREAMVAVAGALVIAPMTLLPSLAWGSLGDLQRTTYPDDWSAVTDLVGDDDTTVVLPWQGSYRGFAWAGRRAVLDPAPRLLPGRVLIDDRVFVDDVVVPSEDPALVRITAALAVGDPDLTGPALRAQGVRWVLVEKGMPTGPVPSGATAYDGPALMLVDLGEPPAPAAASGGSGRAAVIVGDLLTLVLQLCMTCVTLWTRICESRWEATRRCESLGGDPA